MPNNEQKSTGAILIKLLIGAAAFMTVNFMGSVVYFAKRTVDTQTSILEQLNDTNIKGEVHNVEFGYLNGVVSDIQTNMSSINDSVGEIGENSKDMRARMESLEETTGDICNTMSKYWLDHKCKK